MKVLARYRWTLGAGFAWAAGLLAGPAPLRAQTIADARPGEVLLGAVSITDSAMRYAVYLPSAYSRSRSWPIAFLLDPRGRAELPLTRARQTAEQYGYILLSSYNTLSDSATDVNVRAMSAMLEDSQRRLSVDRRRFYLVGFSGTARMAWEITANLRGAVAGMFGSGASGSQFAQATRLSRKDLGGFAFYGVMGETDFNYEEMRGFEGWLQQNEIPHRLRYVPGGHAWPADSVFADAFRWFELRAQHTGLALPDTAAVAKSLAFDTAQAHALERVGAPAEAMARWQEIARDYDAAPVNEYAKQRADRLALNGAVRRTLSRRRDLHQRFIEFNNELQDWMQRVASAKRPPDAKQGIRRLDVGKRLADAKGSDRDAALAAQRELEQAFVMLSFYEPRRLLAAHQPDRALTLLTVADAIRPGTARVALHRAYAWLQLGDSDRALGEVELAIAAGLAARGLVNDPSLAPLRQNPRFRELAGQ
jgi:predicted esterase